MKVSTKLLRDSLSELKPFVETRGQFHAIACAKIKTGDSMEITTTNLDETSSRTIEFEGNSDELLVNFSAFQWSLGESDKTTITRDGQNIIIKCGNKVSRLSTIDATDFPAEPDKKDFTLIGTIPADLAEGIRAVDGFQIDDMSRPILEGTNIKGSAKFIECKATDGRRLALWNRPLISADFEATVPTAFCKPMADALSNEGAEFHLSPNKAIVTWSGGHYACKLMEGIFPRSNIITDPVRKPIGNLEIDTLLPELEACIALTPKDKTPAINLEFSAKGISTSFAGSSENQFDGKFEPFKAIVNAAYLRQCLSCFDGYCELSGDVGMMVLSQGDLTLYLCLMGA